MGVSVGSSGERRQQQHRQGNADGHGLAPHGGQVILQSIQHQQVVAGLQAADGVDRCLQQQHIALPQDHLAEAFLNGLLAAAKGEHRGVVALPEPQFPQAGAGQGGTSRQQHFHGLLTA